MKPNSNLVSVLFLTMLMLAACQPSERKPKFVIATKSSDIVPIGNLDAVPLVLYDNRINFSGFPVQQKKELFIDMLLPSILAARAIYEDKHHFVVDVLETHGEEIPEKLRGEMDSLMKEYHASDYQDLAIRLKPNPTSIVLAQAAIESGWGTSRMFREANNVFGVWSFNADEPRIRAGTVRSSGPVYLRKYSSLYESVEDHYELFATVGAYEKFRIQRSSFHDALELLPFLSVYSEQRNLYVRKIRNIILQNNLEKYDSANIDQRYDLEIVKYH